MKNNEIIPKISSRPNSILIDNINFPKSGMPLKLPIEPTSPKPGPTLPMVVTEPEKAVITSTFNNESSSVVMKIMKR